MAKNKKLVQNQQLMYLVVIVFAVVGVVVFLLALSTGTDNRSKASETKPSAWSSSYPMGSYQPSPWASRPPIPRSSYRPNSSSRPKPRSSAWHDPRPTPKASVWVDPRSTPRPSVLP